MPSVVIKNEGRGNQGKKKGGDRAATFCCIPMLFLFFFCCSFVCRHLSISHEKTECTRGKSNVIYVVITFEMENAFVGKIDGVINMLNYFSWRVKIQQVAILCMIFLKPIVNRIIDELKRPENISMLEMILFLSEKNIKEGEFSGIQQVYLCFSLKMKERWRSRGVKITNRDSKVGTWARW